MIWLETSRYKVYGGLQIFMGANIQNKSTKRTYFSEKCFASPIIQYFYKFTKQREVRGFCRVFKSARR